MSQLDKIINIFCLSLCVGNLSSVIKFKITGIGLSYPAKVIAYIFLICVILSVENVNLLPSVSTNQSEIARERYTSEAPVLIRKCHWSTKFIPTKH